ncbi:hypothetical protein [Streptomyces ficellus]|uniref:Uncharacterized protein n=1 Tax=Streptomyces ficellus TaxID=1977088 RepID=A0A6I6FFS2_9ACTN|nr:hypothetical protein [Streptomyces ficellus]QGV79947.1 hypothetical protein EIZ62_18200 [Streptomyces ficellus]
MGIESDQLVFDYLSRVGDLAQQHHLSSYTRMRLVASLRGEIDSRRAKDDSPGAVRGILTALGTPDEVVTAAASGGGGPGPGAGRAPGTDTAPGPGAARPAVPVQRTPRTRFRRRVEAPEARDVPAAASPHLAGMDELGASGEQPDWWRVEEGAIDADLVPPGFRGGVEIPDMLKPPPKAEPAAEEDAEAQPPSAPAPAPAVPARRRLALPRLRFGHPMLLAAAVALVVGVVLGSWVALLGGWLLAYASGRLSRTEAKLAVFGLPGAVAAGTAVWLWGRVERRWGEPIAPGGEAMGAALAAAWPWTLRIAALASALYLLWRARRV